MVYPGMSEEDVKVIMQYPFNMFASDAGIASFGAGMPHPRAYGTNARVLGKYVKTLGVITLEEAIRRMTSLPANKFNLKNRGLIKEGYFADVIIFDEDEISDMSEYNAPHQYSKGVKYVWVNGALSLEQGKQNTTRKGRAIRK